MRGPVKKVCAGCHQSFECGQYRCWCGKLEVIDRQMDWIAARFEDCLCSVCLGKIVQSGVGPVDKPFR